MTFAVQRLNERVRPTLMAHFLALTEKDRHLRFGTALRPSAIAAYVDRIDFDRDAVFGVHDDQLVLVGVAHVALEDDSAEVGLSVLPSHRDHGIGGALLKRAVAHATNRCMRRLIMYFLSGNARIMRIARRFGMSIIAGGSDTTARLELPSPSLASLAREFMMDSFALYDSALKALFVAWKGQRRAGTPTT